MGSSTNENTKVKNRKTKKNEQTFLSEADIGI